MRCLLKQHVLIVSLLICGSCGFAAAAEESKVTLWQQIPLPPSRNPGVGQIAIERGGVLWAMANGEVYYWAGDSLLRPKGDKLDSGMYLTRLLGGQDRELYLSQPGDEEHQGKLYRLCDGEAHYVTDFYFEVSHEYPGLYVSDAGNIVNWGNRFLSVYVDGQWHEHEALLGTRGVHVAEADGKVLVCHEDRLYVIDEAGIVQERTWDLGGSVRVTKAPEISAWGKDRILVRLDELARLFAFDVNTGRQVDLENVQRQLETRHVVDFFSLAGGTVWLRTNSVEGGDEAFYQLSAKGSVERIEATAELARGNQRYRQYPQSALQASDGAVWLAAEDGSVARIHNGALRRFNWQDGLSLGKCCYVLEGREGAIYAAAHGGIAVWRPDGPEQALPPWVRAWREYRLASYSPIRDNQGHVWMLLADRPGKISRWDGEAWHHQAFPAESIYRGMADDHGHLLLEGSNVCFDVSREGVKRFDGLKTALIAAQARGVERVHTDRSFQGCHFLDTGEIWFGYHNYDYVYRYDGQRWDEFHLRDDVYYLYESAEHGVLIRSQGGKFYRYDRGKLKLVTDLRGHNRLLWSSKMFQPFESALLQRHPRDYVVVEDGHIAVPVQEAGDEGETRVVYRAGDPRPRYSSTLTRGWRHGHWTDYAAAPIYRIWGNRVVQCEWQETPVFSRWHEIRRVLEDRAGHLWISAAGYSPQQVFMKQMDDFQATVMYDGGETITVEPDPAWHGGYTPRVFWRVGNGLWEGGEPTTEIVVGSDQAAAMEIVAMDRQGGTTDPIHIEVQARKNAESQRGSP